MVCLPRPRYMHLGGHHRRSAGPSCLNPWGVVWGKKTQLRGAGKKKNGRDSNAGRCSWSGRPLWERMTPTASADSKETRYLVLCRKKERVKKARALAILGSDRGVAALDLSSHPVERGKSSAGTRTQNLETWSLSHDPAGGGVNCSGVWFPV